MTQVKATRRTSRSFGHRVVVNCPAHPHITVPARTDGVRWKLIGKCRACSGEAYMAESEIRTATHINERNT